MNGADPQTVPLNKYLGLAPRITKLFFLVFHSVISFLFLYTLSMWDGLLALLRFLLSSLLVNGSNDDKFSNLRMNVK